MGYALELYFDLPSSRVILDCWEKLSSICLTFNAKPHISVAIFDDIDTLKAAGTDPEGEMRITELTTHAFFMSTLFLPQLSFSSERLHPLIVAFLEASQI